MMFLLIVTLTAMLLAAMMSTIAWRIAGDEQRRSEARVAALSADIHAAVPVPVPILARAGAARRADVSFLADAPGSADAGRVQPPPPRHWPSGPAVSDLFVPAPARSGARAFAMLGGGVLVFGATMALAILAPSHLGRTARAGSRVAPAAAATPPLELVALGHQRVGDQLTIRGIVRNPSAGAGMDRLMAVVVVLTPEGGFVERSRAAVEAQALQPGDESTFKVTVPRAGDVGRYRVSFSAGDRIVSHVDRRHEQG